MGTLRLECRVFQTSAHSPSPNQMSITVRPQLTFLLPTFSVNSWWRWSSLTQPSSSWYFKCCLFCIKSLIWMFDIHISLLYFYKRHLGQGIERIHQSVKESRWFTELFLRLCLVFVPVTMCTLRSGSWEETVYYRQQQKWGKSKLTCFSVLPMCLTPDGHPVRPFCFALFLLTLWIKPGTSLGLLTIPNTNYS